MTKKNKELIWLNGNLKACDEAILNLNWIDKKGYERGDLIMFWNDYKDCARLPVAKINGFICVLPSPPLKYESETE